MFSVLQCKCSSCCKFGTSNNGSNEKLSSVLATETAITDGCVAKVFRLGQYIETERLRSYPLHQGVQHRGAVHCSVMCGTVEGAGEGQLPFQEGHNS